MDKEAMKKIKDIVDISIDFLKIISKYLGEAVAAILPWHKNR